MSGNTIWVALPLAILTGGAFGAYLLGRLLRLRNEQLAALTAGVFALALLAFALLLALVRNGATPFFGSMAPSSAYLQADVAGVLLAMIACGLGVVVALYSGRYMSLDQRFITYYSLLLMMISGMVGMLMTQDLFNLYLFCELMSISAYVLVAFRRHTDTAIEAGFKYLIMGSVGTLIMLLGIAFVYRETGQLTLPLATGMLGPWQRAGIACLLVGLGLKSAIVPLHTWLPDAYGRAPSSVSALLAAVISKSTLLLMLKVALGLGLPAADLGLGLLLLSFLNMTLGNSLALVQTHTKRLLAYSSIAQTGYIMFSLGVGLRYGLPAALQAGLFLLLTHAVMKATAFLSKGVCHFYLNTSLVAELQGTAQQLPLVALTFALSLAGLAGVPPLAGFVSKWFILTEGLRAADWLAYVGLAIFLLNNLLALGYYLPLIVRLFTPAPAGTPEATTRIRLSRWMAAPLLVLAALILAIGLYPGPWWAWVR